MRDRAVSARDDRLRQTFDALAAIGTRLALPVRDDANWFPVTSEGAASNEPDMMKAIDAFLQRFTQALDHVLRKLFPRLQAAISGDDELLPVRELFENLHRAGVIETVSEWRELLEVRNRLTHEYAMDAIERAATLNDAWSRAPALLTQIERARLYAEHHKLIEGFGR